jgi:hypothetical protein
MASATCAGVAVVKEDADAAFRADVCEAKAVPWIAGASNMK